MDVSLLNWNPRGLNNPAHRNSIQRFVSNHSCNMVVFQETKMMEITAAIVSEAVGPQFAANFIYKPADGTRGGILIVFSDDFAIVLDPLASSNHFITGTVTDKSNGSSWTMTAVYGPQEDADKVIFLQELRRIKNMVLQEWIMLGDFNLIKCLQDKSNSNVNLRMMGRFRRTIDELDLREIHLQGRRFTWSNERELTVHCKLDRVLVTQAWELSHLQYQLTPTSTSISDHCPMILKKMQITHYKGFRFKSCWASARVSLTL
jgi:exonuclease III